VNGEDVEDESGVDRKSAVGHDAGLVGGARQREGHRGMQTKRFFNDGGQEGEVGEVGFLDETGAAYHGVQLLLPFLQNVWVGHELCHRPFDRGGTGIGSSVDHTLQNNSQKDRKLLSETESPIWNITFRQ